MATATESQEMIVRTSRGLCLAGTRITLYSIMDLIKADWPAHLTRDRLNLTDQQIAAALDYIATHRETVEAEYAEVLRKAEENKQYWRARNKDRFSKLAARKAPPGKEAIWEKMQAKKSQLGLL